MGITRHAIGMGKPRVTGPEAMIDTIMDMGIVPFFENPVTGYSIEEMTPAENWFDTEENLSQTPWDWKIACVESGEIAYGKFLLGGKAAFATVEWYKELMNWRRSQEKFQPDEAQRQILDYLADNGSIGIKEIRGLLGVKKGQADAIMTRLQMGCRVVTGDIRRVYRGPDLHYNGWQVSSFCTPEDLFGLGNEATKPEESDRFGFASFGGFPLDTDTSAPEQHSPAESYALLCDHIRTLAPAITDKQLAKLLG